MRPAAIVGLAEQAMAHRADRLRLLDPRTTMARGWSIVRDVNGKSITSVTHVRAHDVVSAQFADGVVTAEVREVMSTRSTKGHE
jgi:exodeoxyribonuclease VII large subunit